MIRQPYKPDPKNGRSRTMRGVACHDLGRQYPGLAVFPTQVVVRLRVTDKPFLKSIPTKLAPRPEGDVGQEAGDAGAMPRLQVGERNLSGPHGVEKAFDM